MSEIAFALFDTAIGRCAIAWNARGIAGVGFPEGSEQATRARMLRRHPAAREASPPGDVQAVIDDIVALLAGSPRDFRHARLDMTGLSDLQRRVYEVAQKIPAGATLTYGEIAERLGDRLLARDVGEALGHNPFPIIVPCHRVLAAGKQNRRLFRAGRNSHQASAPGNRGRAAGWPDPVRRFAAHSAATAQALTRSNIDLSAELM